MTPKAERTGKVRFTPKLGSFFPIQCVSVTQSYPTLCEPTDCSLPGFSVHRIDQARTLEWRAILPDPGIEPRSPALQADSLPSELLEKPDQTFIQS